MKKTIIALFMTLMGTVALNAESYTGTILVTRNGSTNTETATVTVTPQANNLNTLVLNVPFMGLNMTLNMTDVPSATTGGITTYSAERNVSTMFGTMYTILFARVTDGMMAADVSIPAYNTTMWFNTVGDHFQLPNSDMESWTNGNGEPDRWHGFKTAGGTFAGASANYAKLSKSQSVHSGSTGQYSAVMTAGQVPVINTIANGTMTNGQLMANSWSADSYDNHAEMDKNKGTDEFYMPLYTKPDKFNVWLKYTVANTNNMGSVSVKTFDGTYYQEPDDDVYTNLSGSIVGGMIPAGDWTFYSFPIDYDSYAANNAASEAIFVTFSTNANPGQGNKNDSLYVDEMELVYLGSMTDLRYKGTTIDGWNPAVTSYSLSISGTPDLNDFTASIEGASAVVTKSMEQNADGSYRIVISVVSGDLQTATAYIITVAAPTSIKGDVDGNGQVGMDDLSAMINYLLTNNSTGLDMDAADIDNSGDVGMDDLSELINMLLKN